MSAAWSGLLRLIGSLLAGFYAVIPSYGMSIVLLTLTVNALLFPLTLKQTRSMRATQALQPHVRTLRERWKDDRARLQQETMALYKAAGVNPAGGCLPSLLQFPIWIALYRVLRDSIGAVPASSALHAALEAGKTRFLGVDLLVSPQAASAGGLLHAAPYLLLILAVVASAYAQQRQTAARMVANPSQQQQTTQRMMKYLPLFFGFIGWRMPAGLVLYWTASQTLRATQQLFISKLDHQRVDWEPESPPLSISDEARPDGERGVDEQPGGGRTESVRSQPHPRSKKRRKRHKRRA